MIKTALTKPQTGQPPVDQALAAIVDKLNPFIAQASLSGPRQFLTPFKVSVPTDWQTAPPLNGYTGGNLKFRKTNGLVSLEGGVTIPAGPPAANTPIYTLPATCAPDIRQVFACQSGTTFGDFFVSTTPQVTAGNVAVTVGDGLQIFCTYPAADETPIVPSCFPVDIPYSLPVPPTGVLIAQCVDQSNTSAPLPFNALTVQWEPSPSIPNSIRVLNIPGLVPSHTYSVTLLAQA